MLKTPTSAISHDEKVARAIVSHFYDSNTNELSPSKMWEKKGETSVSRLQILEIRSLQKIWLNELHQPPDRNLIRVAIFSTDDLHDAIAECADSETVLFEFTPDPCCVQTSYKVFPASECTGTCPYNIHQLHCPLTSGLCLHPCVRNQAHAVLSTKISRGIGNRLNAYLLANNMIQDLGKI